MSLLYQEPQSIISEEPQENGEDDLQSLTWQEISENNIHVLEGMIEEIIKPVENGDEYPEQLLEVANTISEISSGINSLESDEEDFEQLRAEASGLFVVFWQSYNKSRKLWPPPKFKTPIKELVRTVRSIHKLMKRKCETNSVKRALVGYFGIRNLGKFKKYGRRLDSVASFLESKPNYTNIGEVLLEVINSRSQPRDGDTELSEEAADSPTKKVTKKSTGTQENRAEGSRQREAETSTAVKPTKQKVKPKDEQKESKVSGEKKAKVNKSSNSRAFEGAKEKEQNKTKDDSADEATEGRSAGDSKTAKKKATSMHLDEGVAQPKVKNAKGTKKAKLPKPDDEVQESDDKEKRVSQTYDEEDNDNVDVPDSEPVHTTVPAPKKKPAKRKAKSQSIPAPGPQSSISNFSFTNSGPGNMANNNVGNIYNSSISGVGNDYSVNYVHARRKRTHG